MMTETVHIRFAARSDYPFLPGIEASAGTLFHQVGLDQVATADPAPVDLYRNLPSDARLLIADLQGIGPVGFALILQLDGQAHLKEISVQADQAGRGIGRNLLQSVITDCQTRGFNALTLTTFETVPFNAPFYKSEGFHAFDPDLTWPELRQILKTEQQVFKGSPARIAMIRPVSR